MSEAVDDKPNRAAAGARLAHDVAKYIARTARNVRGEVPAALSPLLIRDWYGAAGEPSPSELFDGSSELLSEADGAFCKEAFAKLAELRPRVEAGQQEALSEGVSLALAIAARIEEGVRRG